MIVWKFWKSFLIKMIFSWHFSHIWYISFSLFRTILPWERISLQSCHGTCENSTFFFRPLHSQSVEITTLPFLHWFCTPDPTLVIRIQKLTFLRLAGDEPLNHITSKCCSDPSRDNKNALRSAQAPTVQLCLGETEGLATMETHLPEHTCKCQRPPKTCGCFQFYVSLW